jgi:multiple sugar transport system permease protein
MQQASSPIPAAPIVATPESRHPGRKPARNSGETTSGYLFLAPYLIVLAIFTLFAVLYGFYLSFFRVDIGFGAPEFIGLRNYQAIWNQLFYTGGVGDFWISMINIVKYVAIVVTGQTIFALILALLLNRITFLRGVFRTIFYLPSVTSSIAVSLIFLYLYTPQGGINYLLSLVGIAGPHWLEDPSWALFAIVLLNIWTTAPTFMIFYLGALQGLPTQLYEAAEVDGANSFQIFWRITLPLLRPITFLIVALGTIGAFQVFDQIIIMTQPQGGPLKSTLTPVVEMYLTGFRDNKFGLAAAMSVILFIFVFIITMIQRSLIDVDIQY